MQKRVFHPFCILVFWHIKFQNLSFDINLNYRTFIPVKDYEYRLQFLKEQMERSLCLSNSVTVDDLMLFSTYLSDEFEQGDGGDDADFSFPPLSRRLLPHPCFAYRFSLLSAKLFRVFILVAN